MFLEHFVNLFYKPGAEFFKIAAGVTSLLPIMAMHYAYAGLFHKTLFVKNKLC